MTGVDKRERSAIFRSRLEEQMRLAGMNRSALARLTGVDRSTIAQLLGSGEPRLPNAQLTAECAQALSVSTDWLLGLTDRREQAGDVIATAISMPRAARSSADDQLMEWHREAAGYKIRHVPATLPDVLKTEDLLKWEYRRFLGKSPQQAITAMRDRHNWLRENLSDYEIALPVGELKAFATGQGYYDGLSAKVRREQLDVFIEATQTFYPSMRIFLYDARRIFSAPITVFGPFLGAVYVGHFYLAFRSKERVRLLIEHFDGLVREAVVDARDVSKWLKALCK
ncbi:MAG TPA: helix-turn-helix transcriptional regulator [Hyphomicrobiales bacterium]|nr:helix-turn-helix transcriptional regulator [Hyphomicrobiales bacterium]